MNNRYGIKYDFNENTGSFGMVIDEILDEHSSNPVANWVLKKAIEQGGGGGGSGVWGEITGTITDQTDLVNYINSHGAGTWGSITGTLTDQTDLINYISNALNNYYTKSVVYTKTEVNDLLDDKVDASDLATVATTGDYNDLSNTPNLATVATSGDYNDLINKPTPATVNDATLTIQKNSTTVGTFTANSATDKTIDIVVPVDAADVDALPDTTKYGARLEMSIDSSTFVVTTILKDQDGNAMGNAQTIDLPLESVVVSGSYDSATKKVILTLKDGSTVEFSVADLVAGLQTEITSTNKLDADLVDDSTSVNKFVSGTVGTDTVPVYLDNGTITACDADFNDVAFIGDTVGTPTNEAYVATANIQDGAVTTAKIADASVTSAKIDSETLASSSVTPATGYAFGKDVLATKKGGIVFLESNLSVPAISDPNNPNAAFYLPAGWRPRDVVNFTAFVSAGTVGRIARVRIAENGEVRIGSTTSNINSGDFVQLSGCTFIAA